MMESVFSAIEPKHAALWSRHTVKLRHRLAESELFTDAGLAALIEAVPAQTLTITTMAAEGHDLDSWRHVDRAGLAGEQLLDAVRSGRIWIHLSGINEIDPRYSALLKRAYDELHAAFPGFRTFKQRLGLLVSSPGAQVFYHVDKPGQGLWQIRGKKRIWIYPATEPFVQPADLEMVVRGMIEEDIPYEPWFDDYAEVIDLEPGDMLHWALNGPHRVQNYDCVNVSLTTEHWTDETRRHYAMNCGNGILRRELGWRPRSRATTGPSFWAKAALAVAWRVSGMQDRQRYKRKVALKIDPRAPAGVASIAPSTEPG